MKTLLTIVLILSVTFCVTAQRLHIQNEIVTIDTMITSDLPKEELFKKVKKWAIINISDYTQSTKGEVEPELLRTAYITDYWAAGGMRQNYEQILTFNISDGSMSIKLDKMRTYVEGQKGWSADKFFVNNKGQLKPNFQNFYLDVEKKFKQIVIDILK